MIDDKKILTTQVKATRLVVGKLAIKLRLAAYQMGAPVSPKC